MGESENFTASSFIRVKGSRVLDRGYACQPLPLWDTHRYQRTASRGDGASTRQKIFKVNLLRY